jgi:aryl-alcohol dehydrogenase-like predicted oxidoreductase
MIGIMLIAGRRAADLGLGTAPFAFGGGTGADSVATVHAALDAGVRLIDRPLIATKGGHWRRGDGFPVDGRPAVLRAHCEISLRTLGVEAVDLYYLHHVDPLVPLTDSVGALAELRRAGKITAIGLSNVTLAQLDEALTIAPVSAVQNRLSYADPRDPPMTLACAERGVAYVAYKTLARPSGAALEAALAVARRHGASMQRALLAWFGRQVPSVVPLVGASRPASIRDSATPLELSAQELVPAHSDGEYFQTRDG